MKRPSRVLFVVNDATFFLSHRLDLALGVRNAGYDVHVATPRDSASARIEEAGLPFHAFPLTRRGTSPPGELRAVGALVALYRKLRPDLVHHVTAKAILYGGAAARITGIRAVVHAVSGLGYVFIAQSTRAKLLRQLIVRSYAVATGHPNCAVIFQNEDDRAVFASAIRAREILMIPGSGVDLSRFRATPLPDDKVPLVVLPARMLWDKGVGELVAATRLLRERGVALRVALVGGVDSGNPAMVPRAQIESWVREGVVEWWGARTDMPNVLAQATIVALPSYREGMPKSLLEACAVGRPIVTTDVPGCRDAIVGDYGRLIPARDAPALADALAKLVGDRSELERMAREAARAAPRFAIEKVIAETVALYERLL